MKIQLKNMIYLFLILICQFALVIGLQFKLDDYRNQEMSMIDVEELYISAERAKNFTATPFSGLIADWYWMYSLQYMGRKMLNHQGDLQIDDLSSLKLKLLAPMLDITTTFDPQFMAPYEFGAAVLPAVDSKAAIKLLRKGIESNPQNWKLYHHLGYIYWQLKDYKEASNLYSQGSKLPGAPVWMVGMAARMETEAGNRSFAYEIYTRMYEQSTDDKVKNMAFKRILQLRSLDERDLIRSVLTAYQSKTGMCPKSWAEVSKNLRALNLSLTKEGIPLDPGNMPYVLKDNCIVDLDYRSPVPYK
jgi:tetratricopeptide (TPR) repeat protein